MSELLPGLVYMLCLLTSLVCAGLLARAWARTRSPLLFWSALCFAFLAGNNLLVFADMELVSANLAMARQAMSAAAVCVLLYGLIWKVKS